MMRRILFAAVALLATATPCLAQPGPRVVKMTVQPAAPSVPVMKYHLLPEIRVLRPGNAAVFYQRSHSPEWYTVLTRQPGFGQMHEWLNLPLAKAPLDPWSGFLRGAMLRELDLAARTEYCDWQLLERIREEGPNLLIPDMQSFRTLIVLLTLRSRLEMREGKFDSAAYTFQTGLAMSRHLGKAPMLVNYLIGATCADMTFNRIEEFIAQPGAPNLYWALTDLPRPLIDLRRPLQAERQMIDVMFPEIRKALNDPHAPPASAQKIRVDYTKLPGLHAGNESVITAVKLAMIYPRAQKYLIDRGRSAADVAALPVTQVSLMYVLAKSDVWTEDFYKLNNLPYWETVPRLKELHETIRHAEADLHGLPRMVGMFYTFDKIFEVKARLQRRVDLLRCVEAIRLYAADHDGAAPASLDDAGVPIPVDPMTGKAFRFTKDGNRVILEAPAPAGEPAASHNAVRMEITLAAPKKAG